MFDITLYQFSRAWDIPNPSPFCMKLEGYLKLGGLPYAVKELNDPRKAPKGKVPFVKIDKQFIGDSEHIYEFLRSHQAIDLDLDLTLEQKAIHHAMITMCDESLYFALMYSRWVDDTNWETLRNTLFEGIPALVRPLVTHQIRKKIQADLIAQGMGRHNSAEVYLNGSGHIDALAHYLGSKRWFGGDQPVRLDVVAVSYLVNILLPPIQSPLKNTVNQHSNLVALAQLGLKEIYGY